MSKNREGLAVFVVLMTMLLGIFVPLTLSVIYRVKTPNYVIDCQENRIVLELNNDGDTVRVKTSYRCQEIPKNSEGE